VDISEFLLRIARDYNRLAGVSAEAQSLLKRANSELGQHVPGGIVIQGSGGRGIATFTPWVAFFDPDETGSAQRGVYVVYIFAEDLRSVTLTLNQGITDLTRQLGQKAAREKLAQDATMIRSALPSGLLSNLDEKMDLGAGGFRQLAYEAGNIAARRYDFTTLPSESELRNDLVRFIELYQFTVARKRLLLQAKPGVIASASAPPDALGADDPLWRFKPKNDNDYVAYLTGRTLVKGRRHEKLIAEYGKWAISNGFKASTAKHPVDLMLRRESTEWLVEGKVLVQGNATDAVRATIGQLFAYRHFLFRGENVPRLLALFSESIGPAYVEFLTVCGIASVWKQENGWIGSEKAFEQGLSSGTA
jgi:hypothetical protein